MNIRPAMISDIPSIMEIYNFEILNSNSLYYIKPKTTEYFIKFLDNHPKDYPLYVIEDNNTIVGFGCLSKYSDREGYKYTVENSVYIHHNHRSKGYGKTMLAFLIEKANELGYKCIVANIDADNIKSIELHKRLGFVEAGRLQKVGFKFGRWLDVVIMQKLL